MWYNCKKCSLLFLLMTQAVYIRHNNFHVYHQSNEIMFWRRHTDSVLVSFMYWIEINRKFHWAFSRLRECSLCRLCSSFFLSFFLRPGEGVGCQLYTNKSEMNHCMNKLPGLPQTKSREKLSIMYTKNFSFFCLKQVIRSNTRISVKELIILKLPALYPNFPAQLYLLAFQSGHAILAIHHLIQILVCFCRNKRPNS